MKIVEYQESFGEVRFPEGFEASLRSRTLEEQMNCYRTTCSSTYSVTDYSQRTIKGGCCHIDKDSDVRALIVRDGLLVGVMMCDDDGQIQPCLPEERVCTYYADDNNGAGSKCRIDYTWLICFPEGAHE